MKKTRVLLTGGSGYIGKNILEQLGNLYDFTYPPHSQLELSNSEAVKKFFKQRAPFDVVIHCAFVGGSRIVTDTTETLRDNLRIFFNIVRNKSYFGKLINIGSGAEYGKHKPLIKVREIDFDKVVPEKGDYYGFAKYVISKYAEESANIVNLRLFGVYGKYEDVSIRFISNAICRTILGLPILINKNVNFDYLYIKDFVKILEFFINHKPKYKSYNVGRGQSIDLITIANIITKISKQTDRFIIHKSGLSNEYTCNNKRLKNELQNFEFYDFEKSLEELYLWNLKRKSKFRRKDI